MLIHYLDDIDDAGVEICQSVKNEFWKMFLSLNEMIGDSSNDNNDNNNVVDMRLKRLYCQLCCMDWRED